MQYFENWLDDLKIEDNKIKEFQNYVNESNVFQFQNKYLEQTVMGSPMSPFLAEIFMNRLDT